MGRQAPLTVNMRCSDGYDTQGCNEHYVLYFVRFGADILIRLDLKERGYEEAGVLPLNYSRIRSTIDCLPT
jgi:hypothetical protein